MGENQGIRMRIWRVEEWEKKWKMLMFYLEFPNELKAFSVTVHLTVQDNGYKTNPLCLVSTKVTR